MNDRRQYYRDYNAKRKEKMAEYDKTRRDIKREYTRLDSLANPEKYKQYRKKNYDKNKGNWAPVTREYEMFKAAKVRAKKKGLDFNIEPSDIVIPEYCPVFPWIKLEPGDKRVHKGSPTIDRVDNNKGYTKDNIAIISYYANSIKQNSNSKELRLLADWIDSKLK